MTRVCQMSVNDKRRRSGGAIAEQKDHLTGSRNANPQRHMTAYGGKVKSGFGNRSLMGSGVGRKRSALSGSDKRRPGTGSSYFDYYSVEDADGYHNIL